MDIISQIKANYNRKSGKRWDKLIYFLDPRCIPSTEGVHLFPSTHLSKLNVGITNELFLKEKLQKKQERKKNLLSFLLICDSYAAVYAKPRPTGASRTLPVPR